MTRCFYQAITYRSNWVEQKHPHQVEQDMYHRQGQCYLGFADRGQQCRDGGAYISSHNERKSFFEREAVGSHQRNDKRGNKRAGLQQGRRNGAKEQRLVVGGKYNRLHTVEELIYKQLLEQY